MQNTNSQASSFLSLHQEERKSNSSSLHLTEFFNDNPIISSEDANPVADITFHSQTSYEHENDIVENNIGLPSFSNTQPESNPNLTQSSHDSTLRFSVFLNSDQEEEQKLQEVVSVNLFADEVLGEEEKDTLSDESQNFSIPNDLDESEMQEFVSHRRFVYNMLLTQDSIPTLASQENAPFVWTMWVNELFKVLTRWFEKTDTYDFFNLSSIQIQDALVFIRCETWRDVALRTIFDYREGYISMATYRRELRGLEFLLDRFSDRIAVSRDRYSFWKNYCIRFIRAQIVPECFNESFDIYGWTNSRLIL